MTVPAASLDEVSVHYASPTGTVAALDRASVTFMRGTSTAVAGRSGSGKSTLISVLALLRRPTTGSVSIAGIDTTRSTAAELAILRSRSIGVVFQAFHLEASLTAVQNVMLPWFFQARGSSRRTAIGRANYLLDALDIGALAARRPHQMSGGQKQRVAIARALFAEPALLLADEPTGNLDEETANGVSDVLMRLAGDFGTAVVVVTHDPVVAAMADASIELLHGTFRVLAS